MDIKIDNRALKKLIDAWRAVPSARVGVLGGGNARKGDAGNTNAEIGRKHEYGIDVPRRSFLREPLTDQMQRFLDNSGAFKENQEATLREIIRSASFEPWVKKVGIVGEAVVLEGFDTGGFGKWKPSNMTHKTNHQTLVETAQLRDSITSDVVR